MSKKSHRSARLHCAASESDADMLYLTRFHAPDDFWFLDDGKPTIFLNELEIDRARRELRGIKVIPWSEVRPEKSKLTPAAAMVAYLAKRRVRKVTVPAHFPLGLAEELRRSGLVVTAARTSFVPEREIKKSDEIAALRQAQKIAETGMSRAREILHDCSIRRDGTLLWAKRPLTSEILRGEVQATLARHGASSPRLIVAGGDQACDPHEAGSGVLRSGEMIIVDIFPRVAATGYWGDITRTFCVGTPRPEAARLHDTVLAAQKLALAKIRSGCDGKSLQNEVREFFTHSGYITGLQDGRNVGFFHGLGHGVGLEIHEAPRISAGKLRAGQVITVEPGLYYPGLGGVRIEDTGAVTTRGFDNFTSFPKTWRVRA